MQYRLVSLLGCCLPGIQVFPPRCRHRKKRRMCHLQIHAMYESMCVTKIASRAIQKRHNSQNSLDAKHRLSPWMLHATLTGFFSEALPSHWRRRRLCHLQALHTSMGVTPRAWRFAVAWTLPTGHTSFSSRCRGRRRLHVVYKSICITKSATYAIQ